MTPDGESQCQLETIRPKTIISTRTTTTIDTWMNKKGERFADLYATSNLVIGGSVFHNRWIHKET
ncbi:hypothetical protein DPMN_192670 [Dreissena polymorpha]|uniref:Uncharacterized protein n=1 Tax=Dreissena polymorpha TaxID=45954 RepID=A0A9D3Y640_DREPO|nr:hypothetical protein DPMN_192670 [Dreissena polymorpha]